MAAPIPMQTIDQKLTLDGSTVTALKHYYLAIGGELTDTYDLIADGVPVSDYVVIPDVINAIATKVGTGGQG